MKTDRQPKGGQAIQLPQHLVIFPLQLKDKAEPAQTKIGYVIRKHSKKPNNR